MKFKYLGPDDAMTLRGVEFQKGKAVDLADDPALAEKVARLDCFAEVKTRKRKSGDAGDAGDAEDLS